MWRLRKERSWKISACLPARVRKARDGGLLITEDPFGGGSVQSFGQRRQHHGDLLGRGFQTIQGGVASSSECGVAGRTSKGLDPLSLAMFAISDQSMDMSICDAGIWALVVGTGVALGVHSLGCSPAAFHLSPGTHRRRCCPYTRRGSGGEATGGAVKRGLWLEKALGCGVDGPFS